MTDKEMTDKDIIEALRVASRIQTLKTYIHNDITGETTAFSYSDVLNLITRQQAEIEILSKEVDILSQCVLYHDGQMEDVKSEAVKEFAERLKEQYAVYNGMEYVKVDLKTLLNTIDNLVKEMESENNA